MSFEQWLQNVHSNEQIVASLELAGKAVPQCSHLHFISNISQPPQSFATGENRFEIQMQKPEHRGCIRSPVLARFRFRLGPFHA